MTWCFKKRAWRGRPRGSGPHQLGGTHPSTSGRKTARSHPIGEPPRAMRTLKMIQPNQLGETGLFLALPLTRLHHATTTDYLTFVYQKG